MWDKDVSSNEAVCEGLDLLAYIFLCELDVLGADEFGGTITVFDGDGIMLQVGFDVVLGIFGSMHGCVVASLGDASHGCGCLGYKVAVLLSRCMDWIKRWKDWV